MLEEKSEGVGSGLMRAHLDHMLTYMQTGCPCVPGAHLINLFSDGWIQRWIEKGWLSLGQRCGKLGVKKKVELESLLCMDHVLTFFQRLGITTLSFSSPASLVPALTQHDLCVQCAP